MVDFNRLRRRQSKSAPVDPGEIFLRLPKSPGFDDLWSSQSDALKQWYGRRNERDIVIKLNTGGGKTLVGLLIAQSTINERQGPVLYLCPTAQLQGQIIEQSQRYGIPAVPYVPGAGEDLSEDFLGAQAVMVATYHALFNGRSKFGVSGAPGGSVELQGMILDDAHTAFSNLREIFSLHIEREKHQDLYDELTTLFRTDFAQQGRQGTYDDIVAEQEASILEVPYVAWANRADEVRQRVAEIAVSEFRFVWPLIRDSFEQCHALISRDQVVITPIHPIMDLFPSFTSCPRRIYMSATVADDSSIIRTFDANPDSVSNPISPASLAGVGERMIIIPELTRLNKSRIPQVAKNLAERVSKIGGAVVLTPSGSSAERWSDVATVCQGDDVASAVGELVARSGNGPYAFPNRYDGIDLPGDSCRLLVLSGMPQGTNVYDLFRATVLEGSGTINTSLAQRIEQGMGRGTRGGGDHCVVLLLGKDLVGWVSRASNLKLLTNTTQEQVRVGIEVSEEIASVRDLVDTVKKCLARSPDWTQFHADALADATSHPPVDKASLKVATAERRCFAQLQAGYSTKAVALIEKFVHDNEDLDAKLRGWLLELGARAAHQAGDTTNRDRLQREAYSHNRSLQRPAQGTYYTPLLAPTKQAAYIVDYVQQFALLGGAVIEFEETADQLVPAATSNQFEEALKKLGQVLGFASERPEKEQRLGPDVLWVQNDQNAWVIEAKSKKQPKNRLTKEEHGQLLQSAEWFQTRYEGVNGVRVVVHANAFATEAVTVGDTMALTLTKLGELVGSVRTILKELSSEPMHRATMVARCESRLDALHLRPSQIGDHYLTPFVVQKAQGAS